MKMSRIFAMPNSETFTVAPIGDFVKRYLAGSKVSVDPFARLNHGGGHNDTICVAERKATLL